MCCCFVLSFHRFSIRPVRHLFALAFHLHHAQTQFNYGYCAVSMSVSKLQLVAVTQSKAKYESRVLLIWCVLVNSQSFVCSSVDEHSLDVWLQKCRHFLNWICCAPYSLALQYNAFGWQRYFIIIFIEWKWSE